VLVAVLITETMALAKMICQAGAECAAALFVQRIMVRQSGSIDLSFITA
jgi:hypothetical protein